jgi:hypothetical protein
MGKKEEHNGRIKYAPEKSDFLGRKKMTCGTEKMHISVLSTKTRNMQPRQMHCIQPFSPHHDTCDACRQIARAYFWF